MFETETTKKYKSLFFFSHEADEPLQVLGNIVVHCFNAVQMKLTLINVQ